MKFRFVLFSTLILLAACDSNTKVKGVARDAAPTSVAKPAEATISKPAPVSTAEPVSAQEKTGWSKTAKGAVIGGVVGAGTGAVVNKKNRAVGAIVGGVVGAGSGAIIGNEMDKKDGRH